ncbi:MAG: ArnT family glycosyltransferase [Thermoleophilia bacterium]
MALALLLLFLATLLSRAGYPYELEWMEGGIVDHAGRVLEGKQLYGEPSFEFTAFTYTPLYFYAGALSAKFFGLDFFALRLVSILASLGALTVIFQFVRRESGSAFFALLAAGLFAGSYSITGYWFDLARPDMLFLCLILAAAYLVRFHESAAPLALAASLAFLAFMSKQTALFIAVPLGIYCLVFLPGGKKAVFPAVFAALLGGSTIALELLSGGWYYFYVFHLPGQHLVDRDYFMDFPRFAYRMVIALSLGLTFIGSLVTVGGRKKTWAWHITFFTSMMFAAWIVSIHEGSFDNVLIPAAAALSIYFGLGMKTLMVDLAGGAPGRDPASGGSRALLPWLAFLLAASQFTPLLYDYRDQVPSSADRLAGDALVARLKAADGEVVLPFHGHLAVKAGKKASAHGIALGDVIQARGEEARALQRQIDATLAAGTYELVVFDQRLDQSLVDWLGLEAGTAARLKYRGPAFEEAGSAVPMTGMKTRPEAVYEFVAE